MVEFLAGTPDAWVGNFAPGGGRHTGAHLHPNGSDILVFASGQGYVINPRKRKLKAEIGGWVEHLWPVENPAGFVLDRQGLAFFRIGPRGMRWHTRRLSWDGFEDVNFTADRITGLAWTPIGESWLPFEVDVATGRSSGGAYSLVDTERWEELA